MASTAASVRASGIISCPLSLSLTSLALTQFSVRSSKPSYLYGTPASLAASASALYFSTFGPYLAESRQWGWMFFFASSLFKPLKAKAAGVDFYSQNLCHWSGLIFLNTLNGVRPFSRKIEFSWDLQPRKPFATCFIANFLTSSSELGGKLNAPIIFFHILVLSLSGTSFQCCIEQSKMCETVAPIALAKQERTPSGCMGSPIGLTTSTKIVYHLGNLFYILCPRFCFSLRGVDDVTIISVCVCDCSMVCPGIRVDTCTYRYKKIRKTLKHLCEK